MNLFMFTEIEVKKRSAEKGVLLRKATGLSHPVALTGSIPKGRQHRETTPAFSGRTGAGKAYRYGIGPYHETV
jgi:hypothetical protein